MGPYFRIHLTKFAQPPHCYNRINEIKRICFGGIQWYKVHFRFVKIGKLFQTLPFTILRDLMLASSGEWPGMPYAGLSVFLCLWFRASLICINNCPTRRNTKHYIYYSASSLYMFRVSTTPIIRSTQNCNYSLRYWSFFCAVTSLQSGQASFATLEAVVTVLCTPGDWYVWHPKHVERTCRIINRLLCVASGLFVFTW